MFPYHLTKLVCASVIALGAATAQAEPQDSRSPVRRPVDDLQQAIATLQKTAAQIESTQQKIANLRNRVVALQEQFSDKNDEEALRAGLAAVMAEFPGIEADISSAKSTTVEVRNVLESIRRTSKTSAALTDQRLSVALRKAFVLLAQVEDQIDAAQGSFSELQNEVEKLGQSISGPIAGSVD